MLIRWRARHTRLLCEIAVGDYSHSTNGRAEALIAGARYGETRLKGQSLQRSAYGLALYPQRSRWKPYRLNWSSVVPLDVADDRTISIDPARPTQTADAVKGE